MPDWKTATTSGGADSSHLRVAGEIPRDIRDFANMAARPDAHPPERGQAAMVPHRELALLVEEPEEAKEAVSEVKQAVQQYDIMTVATGFGQGRAPKGFGLYRHLQYNLR